MNLDPEYPLLREFILTFIFSVLSPWVAIRIISCFVIPFPVAFFALDPDNFSSMADGGGLIYLPFTEFVFLGILVSAFAAVLGYWLRAILKFIWKRFRQKRAAIEPAN